MSQNVMTITLTTGLIMLSSLPVKAMDLNLNMPEESALTLFSDSDWDTMKAHARKVLNEDADGDTQEWLNSETGHSGNITALSTNTINGMLCRNTQFINIAENTSSTTLVNLCKQDNKWFEESMRKTTTVKLNNATEQPQSIVHKASLPQGAVTSKKVISRTSERCRQLFQNIENLKGKPQRRSAAIDLHKAECLN